MTRASIGAAFNKDAPEELFSESGPVQTETISMSELRKQVLAEQAAAEGGEALDTR